MIAILILYFRFQDSDFKSLRIKNSQIKKTYPESITYFCAKLQSKRVINKSK